ncbi:HK97 family phage prohead protease [Schlesneria paludicola]|uniref:HK97 family phage prohead protease n=1 Tax=Schlesneria paludicola TaxID=360056 RepID=UPI00029AB0BE|nr:HK97 family phage prohead protease [Schlesneria paludicola]
MSSQAGLSTGLSLSGDNLKFDIERRTSVFGRDDIRVETRSGGKRVICGYAAKWYQPRDPGSEYFLFDKCVERIAPTAFDRAIREKHNVVCRFNHKAEYEIGSTKAGTCRIKADDVGLFYEADIPNVTNPSDLVHKIESGQVRGSSFQFLTGPRGAVWQTEGDKQVRMLVDLQRLIDVSPVEKSAYVSTTTGIRNSDGTILSRDLERQRQAVATRLRQLNLEEGANGERDAELERQRQRDDIAKRLKYLGLGA